MLRKDGLKGFDHYAKREMGTQRTAHFTNLPIAERNTRRTLLPLYR